jgi:ferredoxin--NADP+ reductase
VSALRVAIVGAGPAGFYAAETLLKSGDDISVTVLDRVPTPWGLVRSGVAPDHPKIKSVSRVYEKTAAMEGFRFFGNVEVGEHVTHDELLAHHHAVIYAYGASGDRRLGIEGEGLLGSYAATDFVAWYNGHPDAADLEFDLSATRAVVVGNGNVALDVARMLAMRHEELAKTDIADHALEALERSAIEEVVVLGRRGPAQAAYTTPELRELADLEGVDVIVDPAEATLDDASQAWLDSDDATPTARRNVETVQQYAAAEPEGRARRIVLRYLVSPVEILGDECVQAVRVVRNELVDEGGSLRARATGDEETIECGLVLRSIGYRGDSIDGLPFDERRAVIPNEGGRVLHDGEPVPGVYATGWIKRGPSGVIGTNRKCAKETVTALLEDRDAGRLPEPPEDAESFEALLHERRPELVDYEGWQRIDAHEQELGSPSGRPRVKLTRVEQLVERARG